MSIRILSSHERCIIGAGMEMQPFVRYVLPAGPAQSYAMNLKKAGIEYTASCFNSFMRPYGGQDLNGKRLLFYRHSAIGDQLMATAIVRYLRFLFPKANIDAYSSPKVLEMWRGVPCRSYAAPMIFEATRAYDYHLIYDQMVEENREPDQENGYDSMFAFAGFPKVEDHFKRPCVVHDAQDFDELDALGAREWMREKYLVYQLSASNPNRTYPPEQGAKFIGMFLEKFPDWHVAVVGTDPLGENLKQMGSLSGERLQRVHVLVNRTRSFRSMIPLVRHAAMVVCPDSSIGHLAGAFPQVPVVSIWGLFSPDDRVKYYTNHRPLFVSTSCPHAPCRCHDFKLPQNLCGDAANATKGEQLWCNVLRAATPEVVLWNVENALR